ncbi:MAG TPA: TadE/TadG family type IV pilus assembly protein [Terriglobales bacterium]|jgi:Flp pilus assembly protein TadG|nr:TadE/TadG family type IV pilus assembly protein [Terriglobales bacterium]
MDCCPRLPHGRNRLVPLILSSAASRRVLTDRLLREDRASAILEFAITLPLLVVFVVGIFDFSGAFNQKQKIEQAAQEGAIVAGAQPTTDTQGGTAVTNPPSLLPVVTAVFNSLASNGVVPSGTCSPPGTITAPAGLTWQYTIGPCSGPSDNLIITINRGWVCGNGAGCSTGPPVAVGTTVTVSYPYHWRFNNVIQLLVPGATYASITQVTESATVHNQL